MKLTGIIIAKNEEKMIADAIDSLSFCDEILIIDNSSEDKTVEIAEKMEARVISDVAKSFSKLRNIGKDAAKGEWLFYLDADERVTKELAVEILGTIKYGKGSAYTVKRKNFYLGKNEWPVQERMERLFKKSALKDWRGELHESPVVEGQVMNLDGFILHYTHRDLGAMLSKTIEWSEIEAKNRYNANHPKIALWRFPRVMIPTFLSYFIKQKGYRKGTAGLVESIYQSFSVFITYAKLWELQNKR